MFVKKNNIDIENEFNKYYHGGYPVLCSSGRVAIMIILNFFSKKNENKIGIFPYASKCVREAVSKIKKPIISTDNEIISYNQWGYRTAYNNKDSILEDSVDTLTDINTNIFKTSKSNFVIWSLPKILGTHTGSIIWCRNKEDSQLIKRFITKHKPKYYLLVLKILSHVNVFFYHRWNVKIYFHPNLTSLENAEIFLKITQLKNIIKDRKKKLKLFQNIFRNTNIFDDCFYPSIIPLDTNDYKKKEQFMKSNCGKRHFFNPITKLYQKVYPLPIHQDVPIKKLEKFKDKFYGKK